MWNKIINFIRQKTKKKKIKVNIKNMDIYKCPVVKVNDQYKKDVFFSEYLNKHLCLEEIKDQDPTPKIQVYNSVVRTLMDKRVDTAENFKKYSLCEIRTKDASFCAELVKRQWIGQAHGIDMVPDWVAYGKSKGRSVELALPWSLPHQDNSFDVIFSYKTLGRVYDNQLAIYEFCRCAKKYVILVIDDITRDRNLQYATTMDIQQYRAWFEDLENIYDLVFAKNPHSKNPDEFLILLVKLDKPA